MYERWILIGIIALLLLIIMWILQAITFSSPWGVFVGLVDAIFDFDIEEWWKKTKVRIWWKKTKIRIKKMTWKKALKWFLIGLVIIAVIMAAVAEFAFDGFMSQWLKWGW